MRFDEDTGLNIGLRQRGGQVRGGRMAAVGHHVGSVGRGGGGGGGDGEGGSGGGGGGGEQTIVFEVPPELAGQVKKESVLLAINNVPVSNWRFRWWWWWY